MSTYEIISFNGKVISTGICKDIRHYYDPFTHVEMIDFTDSVTNTVITICKDFVTITPLAA